MHSWRTEDISGSTGSVEIFCSHKKGKFGPLAWPLVAPCNRAYFFSIGAGAKRRS